MIETYCQCGNQLIIDEVECGQVIDCPRCDAQVLAVTAEMGIKGDGDFDGCLVITKGQANVGRQIFLGGVVELSIGKQPDRSLVLPGNMVSRNHCRLKRVDFGPSRWQIEDNHSTNGLYVNGQKVQARELKPGDVIRIGEYELTYGLRGNTASHADTVAGVDIVLEDAELEVAPPPPPAQAFIPLTVASAYPMASRSKMTIAQTESINRLTSHLQPQPMGNGPQCPSCSSVLPAGAKICVRCGINLKSGRPLLTSRDVDEDILHENARSAIRLISWIIPFGLYPIASEAYGVVKPAVLWLLVGITILISSGLIIHSYTVSEDEIDQPISSMALWAGNRQALIDEIKLEQEDARAEWEKMNPVEQLQEDLRDPTYKHFLAIDFDDPDQANGFLGLNGIGAFSFEQYFTCTLVHADWMHLAGNMLFFIIFGVGLNRLLGNIRMLIVYPLLAMGSGIIYQIVEADKSLHPLVGASGAIMGLAGMYVILFPMQRIHMAAWVRLGLLTGFRLGLGLFAMRGIWVVAFYIGLDVVFTLLKAEDGVAHWAHLGGFFTGVGLAIIMLIARQVPPQGDLISLALGKYAWPIIGKPNDRMK